jgi:Flp pilus assembly pilin Flp
MCKLLKKLWKDDAGFVLSAELMLIATIVVLSVIVGLSEVSLAVNSELKDVASAFGAENQSYNAGDSSHQSGGNDASEIGGVDPQPEAQ